MSESVIAGLANSGARVSDHVVVDAGAHVKGAGPAAVPEIRTEPAGAPTASHASSPISAQLKLRQKSMHVRQQKAPDLPAVYSPKSDVHNMMSNLSSRRGTTSNMLKDLANQSSTEGVAHREISRRRRQTERKSVAVNSMPQQHQQVASRLAGKNVTAMQEALREGAFPETVNNPKIVDTVVKQIAAQLNEVRAEFGVADKGPVKVSQSDKAEAQRTIENFVRELDSCYVEASGVLSPAQTGELFGKLQPGVIDPHMLAQQQPADSQYPAVSNQFVTDLNRVIIVLEKRDGSKQFLLDQMERKEGQPAKDKAVRRLQNFCGDKTMYVSRLANQSLTSCVWPDPVIKELSLPAPLTLDGERADAITKMNSNPAFLIREDGDGGFQITAINHASVEAVSVGGELKPLNPNLSHWNLSVGVGIDSAGAAKWTGSSYDLATLPPLSNPKADPGNYADSSSLEHEMANFDAVRNAFGMSRTDDFQLSSINHGSAKELGENAFDKICAKGGPPADCELAAQIGALLNEGVITENQAGQLNTRLDFLGDFGKELGNLGGETREQLEHSTTKAADLANDIRVIQSDLALKSKIWGEALTPEQNGKLATVIASVSVAFEHAVDTVDKIAADRNAALDDIRGNLDNIASGAMLSRVEYASLQNRAVFQVVSQIFHQLVETGVAEPEILESEHGSLLKEIVRRGVSLDNNIADHRSKGTPLKVPGPGAKKAKKLSSPGKLEKASASIAGGLAAGGRLPDLHANLSEAQLLKVLVDNFVSKHPELAGEFANFSTMFKHELSNEINRSGWDTIDSSFYDLGQDGKVQKLSSTITPAPQFKEREFAGAYGGEGVNCGDRTRGDHAVNLAHTNLADAKGNVLFSGLRHGILDAYSVTVSNLKKTPESVRRKLLADTAVKLGFSADHDMDKLSDEVGLQKVRQAANENMAEELLRAAVVSDPALIEQARAGGEVVVNLDSVSLVTPDLIRSILPNQNRRDERTMLDNQRNALQSLAGKTIPVKINDGEGGTFTAHVKTGKIRSFNFAVNDYGVAQSGLKKFIKPLMGWNEVDKSNKPLLEDMLGPLAGKDVTGDAGAVLKYLDGEPDHGLSRQQMAALDKVDGMSSAFADPKVRAAAIRALGVQVKEIVNKKSHHLAGNEPYKLASRMALLSNLLGDKTAFNCKSGKDRTGQLDAEVKLLAVNAAAGHFPAPDSDPDRMRKTNFALKTGNLEMQQHNTGLRGYKLGLKELLMSLTDFAAQKLYQGDSKHIHS